MRGEQLLKGIKYDVTQRVKPEESVACHSEALAEESKTDSSLTLRMTETCHCEDERSEDVTIQSIKLDYQVNILDSHVADAPQNDGKRAAFTLAETMIVLVILGIVASISNKYDYDENGNQTALYFDCDVNGNNCAGVHETQNSYECE